MSLTKKVQKPKSNPETPGCFPAGNFEHTFTGGPGIVSVKASGFVPASNPEPGIHNPQPETQNPKPNTQHLTPNTRHPTPKRGRPPIHTNPDEVARLCHDYFKGLIELPAPKPPTVTGLTLFLGFASKTSLYEYAKKAEFAHAIESALTAIEQYHEEQVAKGEKCTGNIFILKNFGWHDSRKVDHTITEQPLFGDE